MAVGSSKASIYALKREVTPGTYVPPTTGTDFVPVRPGNELVFEPEILESDELQNDIGATQGAIGKQIASGSFPAYLRHSGVEGQEPELGVMWESAFGSKAVATTEYNTVSGSTTTVIKVDTGEGVNFQAGQALLIKDSTNGYSIRNVKSVSGDDLTLNFALSVAPGVGVNLSKAITYLPTSSGHPTFSPTSYLGNGYAKEAVAGATTTEISITADANGYGEVSFSFQGTKYFYNAIVITATNKFLDVTDDGGTIAVSVPEMSYATPIDLAAAIQTALEAASLEIYTVTYSSVTGKFTIASGSTLLSLLWNTGTNAANSIGATLGFSVAANDTGAVTYTSDNEQSYAALYTPSYDVGSKIVIKAADLFIGNQTDNVCICAQTVSITVSKTTEEVPCVCEESGILEYIATARTATMSVTAVLKKHEVTLLDALLKNTGISAMFNAGPKTGGNYIPGQCFNAYFRNCTVVARKPVGDSFLQVELELSGFVNSTSKDLYVNFI